jgi:hypothetical protein
MVPGTGANGIVAWGGRSDLPYVDERRGLEGENEVEVKDEREQVGDERLKGDRHQVSERTNNSRSTPK